jgi:hypothetical protein
MTCPYDELANKLGVHQKRDIILAVPKVGDL